MNCKIKLIGALESDTGIHLRELSRTIKTSFANTSRYVNLLEKEGVLRRENEANTVRVYIKPGIKALGYLKQLHTEKFLELPKKIQMGVSDFLSEMPQKPLIALIFGSYAKKNYTAESDVDLLLVFQATPKAKDVESLARKISMRNNIKLSPVYVDYSGFEENFLKKEHSFSNELRKSNIIIYGLEIFFELFWRHSR
jgi:predicted nucleotidyltransferase